MKVAAGRGFYERYGTAAQEIAPDLNWALIDADGSWSASPEDCDLIVLAGDAYTSAFVAVTSQLSTHVGRIRKMLAQMGLFMTPCVPSGPC